MKNSPVLLYFLTSVVGLMVGLGLYWNYAPDKVIEFRRPIAVDTSHQSSKIVVLTLDYCKNLKASGAVRTSYVGQGIEILQPMATDTQSPGCHDVQAPVILPPGITPGKYRIKFRVNYRINPLKTVTEEFNTEEFEVK